MNLRSITFVSVALLLTLATSSAWGMYNPRIGRFMQRDPNGMQVGSAAPSATGALAGLGGFIKRDFNPQRQYVDGMNGYAYYAGMQGAVDPSGFAIVILDDHSVRHFDNLIQGRKKYGETLAVYAGGGECVQCGAIWKVESVAFDFQVGITYRTHYYDRWESHPSFFHTWIGKDEFKRTEANIQRTLAHERIHVDSFKRWYNDNNMVQKEDLLVRVAMSLEFVTQQECEDKIEEFRKRLDDMAASIRASESRHEGPHWNGYKNPPDEKKP